MVRRLNVCNPLVNVYYNMMCFSNVLQYMKLLDQVIMFGNDD